MLPLFPKSQQGEAAVGGSVYELLKKPLTPSLSPSEGERETYFWEAGWL
jgi:hypothetical protein